MKHSLSWMAALACAASLLAQTSATGWQTLFNGQDASAWRSYKGKDFPAKGWKVEDGTLHVLAKGGGGDLVTREQFQDFELSFDWKVAPGANSGVMYRVSEKPGAPYETGPEYQVLDDAQHGERRQADGEEEQHLRTCSIGTDREEQRVSQRDGKGCFARNHESMDASQPRERRDGWKS